MRITKKRLKQIIKEELELLHDEKQLTESAMPLPGGNPLGAIDFSQLCGLKGQLMELSGELMDNELADAAMDEIAELLGLGWLEKTAFKAMAPQMVANLIANGFEAAGC